MRKEGVILKNISEIKEKTHGSLSEKIIQFGEGNFLRAFADYITDTANDAGKFNGSVVLCQPIERGLCDMINSQNGVYTLLMRGVENGEVVEKYKTITSVSRCVNPYADYEEYLAVAKNPELRVVISNTTEAGIAYREGDALTDTPPVSYPAKLAAFLYERYKTFGGAHDKGLLVLPVELIESNGTFLKKYILQYASDWGIEAGFAEWINTSCHIANTLVDRIVTGYPRSDAGEICEKLGYEDNLLDTCEPFLFWAIEADPEWARVFPITDLGLDVVFVPDITAYKTRKVRILNGAHTMSVLAAYLSGHDIVLEMMNDDAFSSHIKNALANEIIPFQNTRLAVCRRCLTTQPQTTVPLRLSRSDLLRLSAFIRANLRTANISASETAKNMKSGTMPRCSTLCTAHGRPPTRRERCFRALCFGDAT